MVIDMALFKRLKKEIKKEQRASKKRRAITERRAERISKILKAFPRQARTSGSYRKILPDVRGHITRDLAKPESQGFFKKRKSIYEQLHRG